MHHRHWSHSGVALLEREAELGAEAVSPRDARRLVREVAAEVGHGAWLDAAELAVSEVVTNALLHAHTAVRLSLAVYHDRLCVEVHDGNPSLPLARGYDEQATTGRGLGLVAALALECGVEAVDDGKVVWFCIGEEPPPAVADPREAWSLDELEPPAADGAANVVLRALPPLLWLSTRQHHDALLRELALYAAEHDLDVDFAVADAARGRISEAVVRALDDAHRAGLTKPSVPDGHPSPLPWSPESIDLELHVPPEHVGDYLTLPDVLDIAERLAVEGTLLARPGLPEIVAVRDWACEQVVAQLGGSPPAPWPGTAQERFETATHGPALLDEGTWDAASVRDSDRGVVAADDANRIVAVSRPLASLVGWEVDELVGRRVVTLIPPHLREAHVAGFSRHLSTGESHVLGIPVELPVLHADGHEIWCRFLVERAEAGAAGRAIYRAWLDPVERT